MSNRPQLALRAVTKSYADITVLKSIDLEVPKGAFVSLLGPSGCGKTTTLRCIAGFEFPDSGSIDFKGADITWHDPAKRNFGMVFQSYALFPHLTVRENVSFGLEMRGIGKPERERRIGDILDLVQLTGKEDRFPRQLSGGQQQRVALARAIVFEPDVLLLDEPLANLDAILRDEMRYFIRGIQQRLGLTAIYVTHDQAEAMAMSDNIVVMFGGEIAQIGSPDRVYGQPASRQVASFIGRANFLDARVVGNNGADSCIVETTAGKVVARSPRAMPQDTLATALIRPEDIVATPMPGKGRKVSPADPNTFAAQVTKAVYLGAQSEVTVELDGGSTLTLFVGNEIPCAPGTRLQLSIKPNGCQVLER